MPKSKRRPRSSSKSGFFGAVKQKNGKYRAEIQIKKKKTYYGSYTTAIQAAQAHDKEAIKLGRPLTSLNFPKNAPVGYTPKQQTLRTNNTIGYTGVTKSGAKFTAQITIDGTRKYIGTFVSAMEAALAYDKVILQNSSTFNQQRGSPNFPPEIYEKLVYFHEQKDVVFREINATGFNQDDKRHMIIMKALFPAAEDEKDAVVKKDAVDCPVSVYKQWWGTNAPLNDCKKEKKQKKKQKKKKKKK